MSRQTGAKAAVAVFFALLTILGLMVTDDYGQPSDEWLEQYILQSNLHEYAVRIWGEDSEAAQWYASRGIQRISQDKERDHGQCAYYLLAPVFTRLLSEPDRLMLAWHAYTWLWFMVGCFALYGFCRETGLGRICSCLGTLLLYLSPRFFAEGHYNNKDIVLLSLVLCTLWLGARFLKQPGFLRGFLFSLLGAMATNTKIAGGFAWAVMGLCAVVLVTASRRWSVRMAAVAVWTIAAFVGLYGLLTPMYWVSVEENVRYLLDNASSFSRWTGVVLFRGEIFDQAKQPLPRYYLIWMMLTTLPLYVTPLAAAGQMGALARVVKQKGQALRDPVSLSLTAASLCWFVPLLVAVAIRPTVYNGWRHFYFVFAGVAVLGAHGISVCFRLARRYGGDCSIQYVFMAGLLLFYGWTAAAIVQNHPYQYAYYNRLGHEDAQTGMELDYWDVSTRSAVEQLLSHPDRNAELPLTLGAQDDMSWWGVWNAYNVMTSQEKEGLSVERNGDAPYLFANTTYARIFGTLQPDGYHELFSLQSYGLTICTVYEKDD